MSDGRPRATTDGESGASRPVRAWGRGVRCHCLAWVLLSGALLITGLTFATMYEAARHDGQRRFETQVAKIDSAIRGRLHAYEHLLRATLGLFEASDEVTREDFRWFVRTLDMRRHHPGIVGIAYIRHIRADEVASLEADIRADGFDEVTLLPPGDRAAYAPVVYIEPWSDEMGSALAFDCYTEPNRRLALEQARDFGRPTVTPTVSLQIDSPSAARASFLMYVPLYAGDAVTGTIAERRAELRGFLAVGFRIEDLVRSVMDPFADEVHLHIHDGAIADPTTIVYDDRRTNGHASDWGDAAFARVDRVFDVHGRPWLLRFISQPGFDATVDTQKAWTILILGVTIALLLFGVTWSLTNTKNRAAALARDMTERIRRNEALLEREHREMEEFLYAVSHDLKAPVVTVMGYAAHLERDVQAGRPDELPVFARRIAAAAERMRDYIDDLLELSRIGRVPHTDEAVDLGELAREVGEAHGPALEQAGAVYRVAPEMPVVWGDRARLWELIENLVTNAIKFSATADQPIIEVGVDWRDEAPWLWVRDNGCGIDPVYHDRIFGMFQRLNRSAEGSGVGLAIVKRIAELHGGRVRVESEPGHGARFLVSFDPARRIALGRRAA